MPNSGERCASGTPSIYWAEAAAFGTWLACGSPELIAIVSGRVPAGRAATYCGAFLLYGAILAATFYGSRRAKKTMVLLVFLQSLAGLVMVFLTRNGATAATLAIVAAVLPSIVSTSTAWLWVAGQTIALAAVLGFLGGWLNAIFGGMVLGGFQMFAVASSLLARSEGEARAALQRTHTELLATRALLAERSRLDERLRIARDLHDTLGHHLTALSLQLEVASRVENEKVAEHVDQAHAITRLLLGDVRNVVSELRDSGHVDVS